LKDDDKTEASVDLSADVIPDELLEQSPIQLEFDSIRITLIVDSESIVDSWGTVRLPDGDYEVLRDKVSSNTETKLFVKTDFLGWFDVTGLVEDVEGFGDDKCRIQRQFNCQ